MNTLRAAFSIAGVLLLGGNAWAGSLPVSAAENAKVAVSIDAQPLATALNKWAEQTGMMVMVPVGGDAEKAMVPRVVGQYSAKEALEKLLENTAFTYEFVDARTVAVH